ncbi:MAG: DUF1513 domain-containing protein [Pseudomonadota bacterium]
MFSRRRFLSLAACSAAVAASGCSARNSARQCFVSAAADVRGNHFVAAFDAAGELVFRTPIGMRGHEVLPSPDRQTALVIARRPGKSLVRVALDTGVVLQEKAAASDRHFYGHGVFTPDGAYLLTSENDFNGQRGVITVRDAQSLSVVDEFDSHGIGPHDMLWLADASTLVVANGGIATHPERGREKLNLESMQPNLAFIDVASGAPVGIHRPALNQNSVRHLDVLADDRVVVGMQQQGTDAPAPLVAVSTDGDDLPTVPMPSADLLSLARYTASVCVDRVTGNALVTCPRGNRVTLWDASAGRYQGALPLADAAGVCVDNEAHEFVLTNGRGAIYRVDTRTLELKNEKTVRVAGLSWDNHLTAIEAGVAS